MSYSLGLFLCFGKGIMNGGQTTSCKI